MQSLVVEGGKRISGEIKLQGAKNSALPILAASILSRGETVLKNCPKLTDVYAACRILSHLGCNCLIEGNNIKVKSSVINKTEVPENLMHKMRSSIIFLERFWGVRANAGFPFPAGVNLAPDR